MANSKLKVRYNLGNDLNKTIYTPPWRGYGGFKGYLIIAFLFILLNGLLYGLYTQTILKARKNLAYSTATSPVRPARSLSFQGRLTDSVGNPISSSTQIQFKLYNVGTTGSGTLLYDSWNDYGSGIGSSVVTPDDNGIFSVIIGTTHGGQIPSDVFSENTAVYLEITAGGEVMNPRQQIATVAYALNSETLQGLPPSSSGLKDTIMVIDALGNLNLGETSPTIISTSGTFGIEGQALLLKAADSSGGNIEINPDASGIIKLTTEGVGTTLQGFISATNANLSAGNLYEGVIRNTNRAYNFLDFQNYDIGTTALTSRLKLTAAGNLTIGSSLTVNSIPLISDNNIVISHNSGIISYIDSTSWDKSKTDDYFNLQINSGSGTTVSADASAQGTLNFIAGDNITLSKSDNSITVNSAAGGEYFAGSGLTLDIGNSFSLGGPITQNTRLNIGNTEALYIQYSTGNIGMGTTNPEEKFQIATGNARIQNLTLEGYWPGVHFNEYWDGSSNWKYLSSDSAFGIQQNMDKDYLQIHSADVGIAGNNVYWDTGIILKSDGSVGIGTTNPLYKLDINGDVNITTNLTIGGTFISVGSTNLVTSLNSDLLDGYHYNSLPYDNYQYWQLQTNGTGTTNINSTGVVNIVGGTNISTSISGSTITINNNGTGTTYAATNGLTLGIGASNVFGLGGTLTQNTSVGTSSFSLSFLGLGNTQSLFLASSGLVGIGTTNPLTNLTIDGNSAISDSLDVGNVNAKEFTPLSHFIFNDNASNTTVTDATGNHNGVGSTETSVLTSTGKINSAFDFANTQYVNVPFDDLPTNDFTYTVWVNPTANSDESIFMAAGALSGNSNEIQLWISINKLHVFLNGGDEYTSTVPITTGIWHFIAISRKDNQVKIFIDNRLNGTFSNDISLNFVGCPLLIGADADDGCTGSLGNYFNGKIDDLRVYNFALSDGQISTIYNSSNGTETTTLNYGSQAKLNIDVDSDSGLQGINLAQYDTTSNAINITNTLGSTASLLNLSSQNYSGNLINLSFGSTLTQTAALTGLNLDLSSIGSSATSTLYGLKINSPRAQSSAAEYGIYQSGTNWDFGLYVEDTAYFNEKVGIGTTNPNYNLEVAGSALFNLLGVGSTNPIYALNVGATLNSTNISIGNTLVTSTAAELNLLDGLLATNGSIVIGNGSALTNLAIGTSNQILVSDGTTPYWTDNTGGLTYTAGNGITLVSTQFKLGAAITENTRLNIGNTEALYIQYSTGYLGIGNISPTAKLDITGNIIITNSPAGTSGSATTIDTGDPTTKGLIIKGSSYTATSQPDDIANLYSWQKADSLSLGDGETVATWADSSGNNRNLSQGTTRTPTFKTGIINSQPVLRFNGTSNDISWDSSYTPGSIMSMFFVFKPSSVSPVGILDSAPNKSNGWRNYTSGQFEWNSNAPEINMGLANTAPVILEYFTNLTPNRTVDYYKNGTFVGNYTFASGTTMVWSNPTVGTINGGSGGYYLGDIAEIIIYDANLSTGDRQSVENYLKSKYNIGTVADTTYQTANLQEWQDYSSATLSYIDGNGRFYAPLGSGSTVSIGFSGDTDTGFYSGGPDTLAIGTSGVNRLWLTAGGNIGINTTAPSYKLHINGEMVASKIGIGATSSTFNFFINSLGLGVTGDSTFSDTLSVGKTLSVTGKSIFTAGFDANAASTITSLTLDGNSGNALTISGTSFTTDITLQNGETIDNDTNGDIKLTATNTVLSGNLQIGTSTVISSTRIFTGANGSAGTPAYSFNADTNTGIYGSNDTLSIGTSGVNRLTIDASGNVGINDASPDYKLDVNGSGMFTTLGVGATTAAKLNVSGDANITTSLSIGTSLVVTGNTSIGGTLSLTGTNVGTGTTALFIDTTGKITKRALGDLAFQNSSTFGWVANATSPQAINGGTTLAFTGTNGLTVTSIGTTQINFGLGGTLTSNTQIGTSSFSLSFLGLGDTQSLYLVSSGKVGIGTTNPGAKLHILTDDLITDTTSITHDGLYNAATSQITGNVLSVNRSDTINSTLGTAALDVATSMVGSGSTAYTMSVTVNPGSNQMLLAHLVDWHNVASILSTSVTFNGVGMTKVVTSKAGSYAAAEIWSYPNPPIGTYDLVVRFTTAPNDILIAATTWVNVDMNNPLGVGYSSTGNSTMPDITVGGTTNTDIVVDTVSKIYNFGPPTSSPSRTNLFYNTTYSTFLTAVGSYMVGNDSNTQMSWVSSNGSVWAAVGVPIHASPVGTGSLNISSDLVTFASNCIIQAGNCYDSGHVLSLNQQYSDATASVLDIVGSGTGDLITLDTGNTIADGINLDLQSSSSSQYALKITSGNNSITSLYVRADGNVGIGTTSPNYQLDVAGKLGVGSTAYFASYVGIGTTNPTTTLQVVGTSTLRNILPEANLTYDIGSSSSRWNNTWTKVLNIGSSTWSFQSPDNSRLSFFNNSSGGTETVTLLNNGNVGIGLTNPGTKLDINGSLRLNNNLYLNSGIANFSNSSDILNLNKYLSSDTTPSWTSTIIIPGTFFRSQSSVLYNGKIYNFNGFDGSRLNTVKIYDIASGSISVGTSGGTTKEMHSSVLYGSKVYTWGGYIGSGPTNVMDIYNIATDTWTTLPPGGISRYAHTATLYNGKIYYIGGVNSSFDYINSVSIFNIGTTTWSTGASGGVARGNHTSVLYNGKIYSWGGADNVNQENNTLDIYDIATNSWSSGTSGGTARYDHASVVYNGKIYSWGGTNHLGTRFNTLDIYDIATDTWSTGLAGGVGTDSTTATLYNGKIYYYAGNMGSSNVYLQVYDFGDRQNILSLQENGQNTLAFRTNSTLYTNSGRLNILGGNVGIGTTNPTTTLQVVGTSTLRNILPEANLTYDIGSSSSRWNNTWTKVLNIGSSTWSFQSPDNSRLSFFNNSSGGTETVTLLNNGNVGIGTTNPTSPLTIGSTNASGYSADLTGSILATKYFDKTNTSYFLTPANSDPSKNSLSLYQSGSIKFNVGDTGASPVVAITGAASKIQGYTNGLLLAVGTGSTGVGDTITGWDNQLFLNQNGNVGIGTTNPQSKLDINGDITFTTNVSDERYIKTPNQTVNMELNNLHITAGSGWVGNRGGSIFIDPGSGTGGKGYIVLAGNTDGNVGIGTTNPTQKLQVTGKGLFSSDFQTQGNLYIGTGFWAGGGHSGPDNSWNYVYPLNFGYTWGNKINFLDGYNKNIQVLNDEGTYGSLVFNNIESAGTTFIKSRINQVDGSRWYLQTYDTASHANSNAMYFESDGGTGTGTLYVNGEIGIGTTSPDPLYKLEVNGYTKFLNDIMVYGNINSNGYQILDTSGHLSNIAGIQGTYFTYDGATASTTLGNSGNLYVTGKIGIGTTDLSQKLEINGALSVYGTMASTWYPGRLYLDNYGGTAASGYERILATGPNTGTAGRMALGVFSTNAGVYYESIFLDSSGQVGIGTTGPSAKLDVNGNIKASGGDFYDPSMSTVANTYPLAGDGSTGKIGYYTSDRRLKENIFPLDVDALSIVKKLQPVTFDWIQGEKNQAGFIAQDVQPLIPSAVHQFSSSEYLAFNPYAILPYLVKAIQDQQTQISDLSADLSLTQTGQININYNVSESVLASLGYTATLNEIESAQYYLTDSIGNLVDRFGQFKKIATSRLKAGLITTTNIITNNILSETSISKQLKTDLISPLSENHTITINADASVSGKLTANQIVIPSAAEGSSEASLQVNGDASISGTLYANKIISPEGSFGDLMAEKIAGLREELKELVSNSNVGSTSPILQGGILSLAKEGGFVASIATDSAHISGNLSLSNDLIIGAQLTVQGNTQLGKIFVADNFIETTDTALYIQPSAIGSVHILGDTLVIADTGSVVINGSLDLNGTLLAQTASISGSLFGQLISAIDASVSGTLTANNLVSNKITIATDSSQLIIAQSALAAEVSTQAAELNSNATAGTATLPAGKTEIIIHTNKLTPNSMVYLTPNGSTQNQVVYVKSKTTDSFVIALDNPLSSSVDINWWIIN